MRSTRIRAEDMKKLFYAVLGICLFSLASCDDGSSTTNNTFAKRILEEEHHQSQMVTCPMCGGSGVFSLMPGDVMAPQQTCSGCGGSGQCDAQTAQEIMEAQAQISGGQAMPVGTGGGRSAAQIEYELKKAYELLNDMQRDYEMTESVVARSQYPPMIADMQQRIQQLEAELRNAR